jgi:hypothetical protein
MKRFLPTLLAAALLAPAAANADTVAPDANAQEVATLGGTIVWISGEGPGQTLMRRAPDGAISAVKAPVAPYYRNLDLGRDADGKLILTYARCSSPSGCVHLWDDLDGRRASFRGLTLKDCALSTTPSRWRTRVVYGLECFKRSGGRRVSDPARSGLYVRNGTGPKVRLTAPKAVRAGGANSVTAVDIRGTNVAAIYADISAFAVLRGVAAGSPATALRVGSSEGDTDQRAVGLALAATTTFFTITQSTYGGDPARSIIHRQTAECDDYQVLTAPGSGPQAETAYPALDIAAEGRAVYAVTPGVGITTHEYKPDVGC